MIAKWNRKRTPEWVLNDPVKSFGSVRTLEFCEEWNAVNSRIECHLQRGGLWNVMESGMPWTVEGC